MILITAATGQIGRAIIDHLGDGPAVRALVREPTEIGGVETAVGDFDHPDSLRSALNGVDTLFLAGRDNPDQVEQHARVLDLAWDAGVRRVVKLSAIGARADSPVALMRWHHAIEERLRASQFEWTFLRPHLFMQNLLRLAGDVAEKGAIAAPMGARAFPLVDTRDVSPPPRPYCATRSRTPAGRTAHGSAGARTIMRSPGHRGPHRQATVVPTRDRRRTSAPAWSTPASRNGGRTTSPTIAAAYTDEDNVPTVGLPGSSAGRPTRSSNSSPTTASTTCRACHAPTYDRDPRIDFRRRAHVDAVRRLVDEVVLPERRTLGPRRRAPAGGARPARRARRARRVGARRATAGAALAGERDGRRVADAVPGLDLAHGRGQHHRAGHRAAGPLRDRGAACALAAGDRGR